MSKKKKTTTNRSKDSLSPTIVKVIVALVVVAFSILGFYHFGPLGTFIDYVMRFIFGDFTLFYYLLVDVIVVIYAIKPSLFNIGFKNWLSLVSIYFGFLLLLQSFSNYPDGFNGFNTYLQSALNVFNGSTIQLYSGVFGAFFYALLSLLVSKQGVLVIAGLLLIIGVILLINMDFIKGLKQDKSEKPKIVKEKKTKEKKRKKDKINNDSSILDTIKQKDEPFMFLTIDDTSKPKEKSKKEVTKTNDQYEIDFTATTDSNYKLPSLELLTKRKNTKSDSNEKNAALKGKRLIEVLKQFNIDAELVEIHMGPAVTKFEIKPDSNVKISKISSIQDNLMMELAVKTLRIEAPIPGKNAVGIEIPNVKMDAVSMIDVIQASDKFYDKQNISVALGKDLMGQPIVVSLNKMPHLLIAGATGSGKSVCMNAIITSLLLTKRPDELKMLLIDPKKVEFADYEEIPHLLRPVISDPEIASVSLDKVVQEMERRYEVFAEAGVRNIESFNKKMKASKNEEDETMPWIVVIIDELADLMAVAGKEVEMSIQRITQLARAAGIHLIVATQRPSVDVVTGIIKANIPSRIAFAVSSAVDSRTILDTTGAEKLLGQGDMLYLPMGEPNATRVQGVYVSDDEVVNVVEAATKQMTAVYDDNFIDLHGRNEKTIGLISSDPIYQEAYDFVVQEQKASTSLLQRRFKIGYNRAANLIDDLEDNGVIGPANGSKPRIVLLKPEIEEDIEI